MQLSHVPGAMSAVFDDPNLVPCAGLAAVVALAQRCGLAELVADKLTLPSKGGVNAHLKVPALVAGMVAGADCIDDMDLLRHGRMDRLFGGVRAPSTMGTFLRTFTFGHVRQLDSVAASLLVELAAGMPLLAGADQVAFVDVDDTVRATHGYAKQGAGFGYCGVKGLNALLATVSTALSRPVIAATRLRAGRTNSARGAARLVAVALTTAKTCGAGGPHGKGLVVLRADSAFYGHDVIAAARRAGARFSMRGRPSATRSGSFAADSAWLVLAAMAFNLTRAAGCLASTLHARATTGTIRAQLINVPTRLAHSARKQTLHLPQRWPWQQAWQQLFDLTMGAPPRLATS